MSQTILVNQSDYSVSFQTLNTSDLQGASGRPEAQEEGSGTEGFPEQQQQQRWWWRVIGPQCSEPAPLRAL